MFGDSVGIKKINLKFNHIAFRQIYFSESLTTKRYKFHGEDIKTIDEAVIRFAGDSGDGMQLTGGRFTETTAIVGNDLSTLPDFPAEMAQLGLWRV